MIPPEFRDLLEKHTVEAHPFLCPELKTREGLMLIPLWEATEALAGDKLELPFWAYSWPGSQAIARHVLDHPETVRGRVVLDLGCGNGIAGMAAVLSGASTVVANDIDPAALRMTEFHAEQNGLSLDLSRDDLLGRPPLVPPVEVILVGDMFYTRRLAERVAPWLDDAARAGARVLLGDPGRAYLPTSGLDLLQSYDISVSTEIESTSLRSTRVFRWLPL